MHYTRIHTFVLAPIWAISMGLGCRSQAVNLDHCWFADGNATCEDEFGAVGARYCTTDADPCGVRALHGCVQHRPEDDECYSPCGGGQSILDDASCLDEAASGEDGDADDSAAEMPNKCGNALLDEGEECDDGNSINDDECSNMCVAAACGDGIVQKAAQEECDDGDTSSGDGCLADCHRPGGMLVADMSRDEYVVGYAVTVDAGGHVYVLGGLDNGLELASLNDDFGVMWWHYGSPSSEQPSLVVDHDGGLIVGGQANNWAHAKRFRKDGFAPWSKPVVDEAIKSMILSVATKDGYVVAAGRRGENNDAGLLVRIDGSNGEVSSRLETAAPLGPVAVDVSGRVWVVAGGESPELLGFAADDDGKLLASLAEGVYTDMAIGPEGSVYLLAHAPDKSSFWLSKFSAEGVERWSSQAYEGATADGFALLPGDALVVAGYTSDRVNGVLAWYEQSDGALAHSIDVHAGDEPLSFFYDVAVAPSGDFAVAVGGAGTADIDTGMWIYEFEI